MTDKMHFVLLNIKNELRHVGFANVKVVDNTIRVSFPTAGKTFYVNTIKEIIDSVANKYGYIQDYSVKDNEYIAKLRPKIW